MKFLICVLLTLSSLSSFAATWKPVAKAIDCPHDIHVLAKPGEKHVMVEFDGKKYQLNSDKDESYSEEALVAHQFVNEQEKMRLTLPGYVEGNPPKFNLDENGKKIHCRMNLI